jgi:two-component system NtrC family sensor kinase
VDYYKHIKKRILISVIVAGVAPLLIITGILLFNFQKSYERRLWSHLELLIKMHSEYIDSFLIKRVSDMRILTRIFTFAELAYQPSLEDKLFFMQSIYGTFYVDLGVVDERGIQVSYAGPYRLKEANYSDAPWFQKAINRDTYVSDVFLGLRNYPHFIVAVRDDWFGKKWVLKATIDFMAFSKLVENIRVGSTGTAFIVNKKGEFQTAVYGEIEKDIPTITDIINNSKCPNSTCIRSVYNSVNGRKKILVGYPLKDMEWLLVFTQEYSDAFSEFNSMVGFTLITVFATLVGVIFIGLFLSQKIEKRLQTVDKEKEMLTQQIVESGKLASIGELAAGIAHEINNPVAIMVEEAGWLEDLLEEEDFKDSKNLDEFKRSIKQIKIQGKRCKDITHKLLSFARKTDPAMKELDINIILKELVSLSTQRAKYGNVRILERYGENLPKILGSESELQQVFLNIINNAIDAMEKKGGELYIETGTEGNWVFAKFKDTGHGIPKANLSRIFDPFFTTKPVGKGTGLGLSICFGIVKKLGGEIRVESIVDVGTTFTVLLPKANGNGLAQGR